MADIPGATPQASDTPAPGADPTKTPEAPATPPANNFDPSKVSDEDFAKIFDDPRVFNHSRFKELNTEAQKAKKYEAEQEKARQEKMLEEKKYTELLAEKDAKINELATSQKTLTLNQKIMAEAQKIGVVDPEAILQLIDRSGIEMSDDGSIKGVTEAVKTLLDGKPYLKGTPPAGAPEIGGATNPGSEDTTQVKRFKHSQLLDPTFYKENEADILASMKAGMIEQDV